MVVPTQLASATVRIPLMSGIALFVLVIHPPLSRLSRLTNITARAHSSSSVAPTACIRTGISGVPERTISSCQIPRSLANRGSTRLEPLVGAAGCVVDPPGDRAGLRLERVQEAVGDGLGHLRRGQRIGVHPRDRVAGDIGGTIRYRGDHNGPRWAMFLSMCCFRSGFLISALGVSISGSTGWWLSDMASWVGAPRHWLDLASICLDQVVS